MKKEEVQIAKIEWLKGLQARGRRYQIRPGKRQDDKSARRIAILVSESFLRHFPMKRWAKDYPFNRLTAVAVKSNAADRIIHIAGFLEADIYREARRRCLHCGEIDEEERIRELGRRGRGIDPLKLHPDTGEHNPGLINLIFDNLLINQEGVQNEQSRRDFKRSIDRSFSR